MRQKRLFDKGQGIVEYVLLTAMVALATIAIVKGFRGHLQQAYDKAGQALVQGVDDSLTPPSGLGE